MSKARTFYGGILRDVVEAILRKDWFSVRIGEHAPYYTFGLKGGSDPASGMVPMEVTLPPDGDDYTSFVARWLKASRTASSRPDHMDLARRGYARLGADLAEFDRVVQRMKQNRRDSGPLLEFCLSYVNEENGIELMGDLCGALQIDRLGREREVTFRGDEADQAQREQEVLFFQEVIDKTEKAAARSQLLEPMPFVDPLVEEATRCFLYQFYRATVLLCGTAIEVRLDSLLGDRKPKFADHYYARLVDAAVCESILDKKFRDEVNGVFKLRNSVAHSGEDPGIDTAQGALDCARVVLETLHAQY